MRDEEDGQSSAMNLLEQCDDAIPRDRIEIAGRFVGEQEFRAIGEGASNRDALAFTPR